MDNKVWWTNCIFVLQLFRFCNISVVPIAGFFQEVFVSKQKCLLAAFAARRETKLQRSHGSQPWEQSRRRWHVVSPRKQVKQNSLPSWHQDHIISIFCSFCAKKTLCISRKLWIRKVADEVQLRANVSVDVYRWSSSVLLIRKCSLWLQLESEPVPDTLPSLGVGRVSARGLDPVQMEDWKGLEKETRVLGRQLCLSQEWECVKELAATEPPSHADTLLAQSVVAFREEIYLKV